MYNFIFWCTTLFFSVHLYFPHTPFEKPAVASPLVETNGSKEILRFHYQTLYLPNLDARLFMYGGGLSLCYPQIKMSPRHNPKSTMPTDLMTQILTQFSECYSYRNQLLLDTLDLMRFLLQRNKSLDKGAKSRVEEKITTSEQSWKEDPANRRPFLDLLAWMKSLLARNENLDEVERSKIVERLFIPFEQLWGENPTSQKMPAQAYDQGGGEGRVAGIQAWQSTLVELMRVRFPDLTTFAQKQAQLCNKPEVLKTITWQLFVAQEMGTAQTLLESLGGSRGEPQKNWFA